MKKSTRIKAAVMALLISLISLSVLLYQAEQQFSRDAEKIEEINQKWIEENTDSILQKIQEAKKEIK